MYVIGDVHGNIETYLKIVRNLNDNSLQVGDFGFKEEWDALHKSDSDPNKHKINMGNHDYLPYLETSPYSTTDFNLWKGIFIIRGADSIDKEYRIKNVSWFENEELSYAEARRVDNAYFANKPRVVVSHDCPQSLASLLYGIQDKSITRQLLEACFKEHKPEYWIYGHHHRSVQTTINYEGKTTTFIGLAPLEVFKIPEQKKPINK